MLLAALCLAVPLVGIAAVEAAGARVGVLARVARQAARHAVRFAQCAVGVTGIARRVDDGSGRDGSFVFSGDGEYEK